MAMSQARIDANRRYNEKAYDRIGITVPKGKRDEIKAYAEAKGESVNALINRLLDEEMRKELG